MLNLIPIAPTCKAEMSILIAALLKSALNGPWSSEELLLAIGDAADNALMDLTE
jgi:hypothetical protein